MITGKAKTDYQREYMRSYMRKRRAALRPVKTQDVKTLVVKTQPLRPEPPKPTPPPVPKRNPYAQAKPSPKPYTGELTKARQVQGLSHV